MKQPLPKEISPELATLADAPPTGNEWMHEIKQDGYRLICRVDGSRVQLLTRNHLNWSQRLPSLVRAVRRLPLKEAILDGEVVILDGHGRSSYQLLQNAFHEGGHDKFQYFAFDLLYLDGNDLQHLPLEERRRVLEGLLRRANVEELRFSQPIQGGAEDLRQCARMRLEGIVSKRRDSPYTQGRSTDWIKTKCVHRDEFVIGGFTRQAGEYEGFEALLLGRYDELGQLIYVGKVDTGFSNAAIRELTKCLSAFEHEQSPFTELADPSLRLAHFVQPKLVGQIEFALWDADGLLCQATFLGLREDLSPSSVISLDAPASRNGLTPEEPGD